MNAILNALQGNSNPTLPIWLMRQAGRYLPEYRAIRQLVPGFMDLCFHEEFATEVTLQPLQRFDLDAAILFSDILVIPHVLGQNVQVIEKVGPVLAPINASTFFDQAKELNIKERLEIPLKVLSHVRKALPSTKAVIGFSGSPWTIATYMLEQGKSLTFHRAVAFLKAKDLLFTQTMELLEEAIGTFLIAQIDAGADVVQVFDSWAKVVPLEERQEWIIDPIRRLISRIRTSYPEVPIIYYGRGVSKIYPQISQGYTNIAFSVDEDVPLQIMKDEIQKLGPVQGNLNPQVLVEGGQTLRKNVAEILKTFEGSPFIFNLGHGIVPQTPPDHVSQLIELVKGKKV